MLGNAFVLKTKEFRVESSYFAKAALHVCFFKSASVGQNKDFICILPTSSSILFCLACSFSLVSSPTEEQNTSSYFRKRKFGSSLEHDFESWLKIIEENERQRLKTPQLLTCSYLMMSLFFFAKTSFLMLSPALVSPTQAVAITSQTVLLEI